MVTALAWPGSLSQSSDTYVGSLELAYDVYSVIDAVSSEISAERAKLCDVVKVSHCLLATCADIRLAEIQLAQAGGSANLSHKLKA